MSKRSKTDKPSSLALDVFQPTPDVLYSLDEAAHLAGVPRHAILVYCNAGLVRPVLQPPHGEMGFTEEAIYSIRRIEYWKAVRQSDMGMLKIVFDLLHEVERLRAEVRFLRDHSKSV